MKRARRNCLRKRYMTKAEAYAAQRAMWGDQKFRRVYSCPECSGWHLARHQEKTMETLFDAIAQQREGGQ